MEILWLLLFGMALFATAFSSAPEDTGDDTGDGGDGTGDPAIPDAEPLQPVQDFFAGFTAGNAAGGTQHFSDDANDPATGSDGNDALFLGGAGSTADGGAGDDLIVLGSGSAGAIYTDDVLPQNLTMPTEADPSIATGGEGQDIFVINIDTLRDGQFFEITDFNQADDTLVLANASEHAFPEGFQVRSVEAQPAEDGSYTDVLVHTDSGAGDTLTTIRLMGVSNFNPDNLLLSDAVDMPIGPHGTMTDDPFTISTPMHITPAGTGVSASIDVTGSDDAFIGTGAGDDSVTGTAGSTGDPASLSIHTGAGSDSVDIRNAAGTLATGEGDDVLEFDGAMESVDPGAGADTLVLHLQADDPAGATIIRLNDPTDSLQIDVAEDVSGSIHAELERVGDTSLGQTHAGSMYLNIYLTDTANPDTSALTPIARLYLGEYEAGSRNGTDFITLTGNSAPDLSFNRPQISGWQPGDSLVS